MKKQKINNEKLNSIIPEIEKGIRDDFGSIVKKIILYGSNLYWNKIFKT